jgi:hypothetical protein
MVENPN